MDAIEYRGYKIEAKIDSLAFDPLECTFYEISEISNNDLDGALLVQSEENFDIAERAIDAAKDYVDKRLIAA